MCGRWLLFKILQKHKFHLGTIYEKPFYNVVSCFTKQEGSDELSSQIITSKSLIMLRALLKLITD